MAKPFSTGYLTAVQNRQPMLMGHLMTITTVGGLLFYYTDLDLDIVNCTVHTNGGTPANASPFFMYFPWTGMIPDSPGNTATNLYNTAVKGTVIGISPNLIALTSTGSSTVVKPGDAISFTPGNRFLANAIRFDGVKRRIEVGMNVDEMEIKASAYPTETLGSESFFNAVVDGVLDGASFLVQRAFWSAASTPYYDYQAQPLEVFDLWYGFVSDVTKAGPTVVEFKVKSPLNLLNIGMPRNVHQASCLWTLYDEGSRSARPTGDGCTMVKANFACNYAVGTVIGPTFFKAANVSGSLDPGPGINVSFANGVAIAGSPNSADGLPTFLQGRLTFTTGVLAGQTFQINTNDAVNFYLQYPIVTLPSTGDAFTAYPGCNHTFNTCGQKFGTNSGPVLGLPGNQVNFRGFDLVPNSPWAV